MILIFDIRIRLLVGQQFKQCEPRIFNPGYNLSLSSFTEELTGEVVER